ncbi:hypothetical protein Bca4012_018424 [Brassica carinata]
MDPRNPYNQNSGYTGLLHNVQNIQENFPYESFPSSVDIGASKIPPFSSQQSEAPSQPQDTPVERLVRRKWTPDDDEVLISAWLYTLKDAVVGNEQKSRTFWKRIDEYFAEIVHENIENVHCKQRWHRINDQTNKFCAAFAAAERQITSGQSDNDVLNVAHKIFYSDQGHKFTLEHAWCLLRYEQKWMSLNTPKTAGSKRKSGEVSSQSSSAHVGEVTSQSSMRPEGIKAAKASRNSSKGKAIEEYKSMMELKMEDLARKEKLSKLAILDTLLGKKDLSENEEAVKNKLLAECF